MTGPTDQPKVQCWHTEPDSPCDWNACRQPERQVTVQAEFYVCCQLGDIPVCGDHLPIVVRRAFRLARREPGRCAPPAILPAYGQAECTIETPHPWPTHTPSDGFSCPRPLTGPCMDTACDHD